MVLGASDGSGYGKCASTIVFSLLAPNFRIFIPHPKTDFEKNEKRNPMENPPWPRHVPKKLGKINEIPTILG